MSLNVQKFELLQYQPSSRNYLALMELPFTHFDNCYLANSTLIEPSKYVTDLGITLDHDFSFSVHITDIVKKARNKLSWILSVFKSRNELTIMTTFNSLVRPLLEYCCVLWNPVKMCDIALLEGVQRTATSKIEHFQHLSYWERLKELNLMSLQRRRERYIIMYMFKILHHSVPNDVHIDFYFNPRLGMKAKLPSLPNCKKRLSTYDASFSVRGPILWNLLPKHVNSAITFSIFKLELDRFIMSFPDHPPVNGYSTINSNSLTCWV